jgi:four helix bundle protein
MNREQMKARTKAYANRVVKLCGASPDRWVARRRGDQLLRSGTSVGANYRAVCRAKSTAGFINKLHVGEEACDESLFSMELRVDNDIMPESRLRSWMAEGNEILSIVVASSKTARTSPRSSIADRQSEIRNAR